MVDELRPVPLHELRWLPCGQHWSIEQHLPQLQTLTPVRGELQLTHRGALLEVEGCGETIVTLCCDRCLQHFNHPLAFSCRELLWLGDDARSRGSNQPHDQQALLAAAGEQLDLDPLDPDAPIDSLDPRGDFDPGQWVFEQLNLQLPLVNRCGSDCPGPPSWSSDPQGGDPRWAALRALRP
ncbi:MAG: YceD family protein [Cyanobacteriota bacterium]